MKLTRWAKVIGRAVYDVSLADQRWSWSWTWEGLRGQDVMLRWGYLEKMGRKNDGFLIQLHESGEEVWLQAEMGSDVIDENPVVTIGKESWNDAKTVEEAIPMIINRVAKIAHARY